MKLIGFTTTYNVEWMVDIVMPYIEMLGYDKFVVYDNCSTDNTVEKLKKYPFIEIRRWDTEGKFDEIGKRNLEIESFLECKKMCREDSVWMTWTDFDEIIYYYYDVSFKDFLFGMDALGKNCMYKPLIQLMLPLSYSKENVISSIKEGQLPHQYTGVVVNHQYSKPVLFHVNSFSNLYFIPGNHFALAEEDVVSNIDDFPICLFHLKYYFHDEAIKRDKMYADKETIGTNSYATAVKDLYALKRLYGASYPIGLYFQREWEKININNLYRSNNDCWGELVYRGQFWKE